MCAIARGGIVTDFDDLPLPFRKGLAEQGINSQRDADNLTVDQTRLAIRELLQRVDDARAGRHPLGDGADPGKNYRRQSIRDALKYMLRLYYAHTSPGEVVSRVGDPFASRLEVGSALGDALNSHSDARVGMRLADRFVSRLEIACALDTLAMERPDLHVILELRYQRGWAPKRVAGQLQVGRDTLANRESEGLDFLIGIVWR